jgi:Ca2+-binding RTX toxin-like protein
MRTELTMPVVACAVVGALLLLGTPNTATAGVGDCGISDESTNPILGTTGDDHIRGTSGDDVILGLGGNDEIRGLAGKDQICTEDGDDTIYPGRGSDYTYAGDGNNEIVERDYSSNIYAGSGDDVVRGRSYFADVGSGNNRTYGADGVVSGNGHDIIIGAAFVQSGAGRDRIDSSDVRNTVEIHAGKGDDFIHGTNAITQEVEEAVEELHGGRGDDRIYGGQVASGCGRDPATTWLMEGRTTGGMHKSSSEDLREGCQPIFRHIGLRVKESTGCGISTSSSAPATGMFSSAPAMGTFCLAVEGPIF